MKISIFKNKNENWYFFNKKRKLEGKDFII